MISPWQTPGFQFCERTKKAHEPDPSAGQAVGNIQRKALKKNVATACVPSEHNDIIGPSLFRLFKILSPQIWFSTLALVQAALAQNEISRIQNTMSFKRVSGPASRIQSQKYLPGTLLLCRRTQRCPNGIYIGCFSFSQYVYLNFLKTGTGSRLTVVFQETACGAVMDGMTSN